MGIIKSSRKFGIEIEGGIAEHNRMDEMRNQIARAYQFVHDGSIQLPNGVEIVSPVLEGSKGEKSLIETCKILEDFGFNSNHISCGLHVHLDGADILVDPTKIEYYEDITKIGESRRITQLVKVSHEAFEFFQKEYFGEPVDREVVTQKIASVIPRSRGTILKDKVKHHSIYGGDSKSVFFDNNNEDKVGYIYVVNNRVLRDIRNEFKAIEEKLYNTRNLENKPLTKADSLFLKDEQKKYNDQTSNIHSVAMESDQNPITLASVEDVRAFDRIKNLLYFYTAFDDMFLGMMPMSRRKGNTYCTPLSQNYKLEEIEKLKNQDDFDVYWYKARDAREAQMRKGTHRDDSRYQDVNFHALFNHGTLEVRSHFGETNSKKILLWVALHQHFVDLIVANEIGLHEIKKASKPDNIRDKALNLFEITNLPSHLREYVQHYLNHFSKINF